MYVYVLHSSPLAQFFRFPIMQEGQLLFPWMIFSHICHFCLHPRSQKEGHQQPLPTLHNLYLIRLCFHFLRLVCVCVGTKALAREETHSLFGFAVKRDE